MCFCDSNLWCFGKKCELGVADKCPHLEAIVAAWGSRCVVRGRPNALPVHKMSSPPFPMRYLCEKTGTVLSEGLSSVDRRDYGEEKAPFGVCVCVVVVHRGGGGQGG